MLEREFGAKSKGRAGPSDEFLDDSGKPLIGSVDAKGNLVTQGPRKRAALRFLQVLLAAVAATPSIYAAIVIKTQEPPPPSNKPPTFVLYIFSVLTLLALLYLFVVRPCCSTTNRRKGMRRYPPTDGILALPVQGLAGGQQQGKKKKGKGNIPQAGDVHVNLIVDPYAFERRSGEGSAESADEDTDGNIPGSIGSGKKRSRPRRRGVFAGLAMEEDWKNARAWAKKMTIFDIGGLVFWGAIFVFILIGKRCPSGGFQGWCNAYNVSSAAACLLCISFGVSTFFDVKDLHNSKMSPRTRT